MTTIEPDLESRINARCMELSHRLDELEADTRLEAAEACHRLNATLSELRHIIKAGLVDDWATVGSRVAIELHHWLATSAAHLTHSTT